MVREGVTALAVRHSAIRRNLAVMLLLARGSFPQCPSLLHLVRPQGRPIQAAREGVRSERSREERLLPWPDNPPEPVSSGPYIAEPVLHGPPRTWLPSASARLERERVARTGPDATCCSSTTGLRRRKASVKSPVGRLPLIPPDTRKACPLITECTDRARSEGPHCPKSLLYKTTVSGLFR